MSDVKNPIAAIQNKQFESRLELLKEGFAAMEKINVRSIPESIFLQYFLPFFSGESTENSQELLNHWFTIAGNTYAAVNIVNNNGQFIIQVPPIHDRTAIAPILARDQDLSYTFKVAQEKATLSPILANNIINNELGERFNTITSNDNANPVIKDQWIKLFQYYGKIPKESIKTTSQSKGDEDEFDY